MSMKTILLMLSACLAVGTCGSASATPVTFDFTGVITNRTDFITMKTVADNNQVTGSVTFEILDPQANSWSDGTNLYYSHSENGCYMMRYGACVVPSPTAAPVITNMVFKGDFGTYSVHGNDAGKRSMEMIARVANRPASEPTAQFAEYSIANDYTNYEGYSYTHLFEIGQLLFQGNSLFQDINDLEGAIDLAGAIAGFTYSSAFSSQNCTVMGCDPVLYPVGAGPQMSLNGTITSFTLHQDAAEVPEPATLLLGAGGALGMLARRRRKQAPRAAV
jgi:hypothetical protein